MKACRAGSASHQSVFVMTALGRAAVLAVLFGSILVLTPAAGDPQATGVPRDSVLSSCTDLKASLQSLHRYLGRRDTEKADRVVVQSAVLRLYQLDRKLGCSFPPPSK